MVPQTLLISVMCLLLHLHITRQIHQKPKLSGRQIRCLPLPICQPCLHSPQRIPHLLTRLSFQFHQCLYQANLQCFHRCYQAHLVTFQAMVKRLSLQHLPTIHWWIHLAHQAHRNTYTAGILIKYHHIYHHHHFLHGAHQKFLQMARDHWSTHLMNRQSSPLHLQNHWCQAMVKSQLHQDQHSV